MSTYLQMKNKIANYLNRSDLSTEIGDAINRAIEFYESERFYFQETSGTFSTVANQESYTTSSIPTDIREIDIATITLSSSTILTLTKRSFDWIREKNVGASTGTPENYAWYNNKIWLYTIPNQVWTITLYYKKSYTALSNDSDTNDWTTKAEDLIENHAMWQIYDQVLKDSEQADKCMMRVEKFFLPALKKKTSQLIGTRQIRPTDY
jgi:hypothetical protein